MATNNTIDELFKAKIHIKDLHCGTLAILILRMRHSFQTPHINLEVGHRFAYGRSRLE